MADNGNVKTVSDSNFAEVVEKSEGLTIVDFWAAWCGPCRMVAPIIEQLADEYAGKVTVAKLDVDANQRTAMRFNSSSTKGPPRRSRSCFGSGSDCHSAEWR